MSAFIAKHRFARITARKARLAADLIRGRDVNEALEVLQFSPRRAAVFYLKVLKSAVANANQIENLAGEPETLIIGEVVVDGGPMLKRFQARAMGRACTIRKRTSHMTIKLYMPA